jgi:hypothetical protein
MRCKDILEAIYEVRQANGDEGFLGATAFSFIRYNEKRNMRKASTLPFFLCFRIIKRENRFLSYRHSGSSAPSGAIYHPGYHPGYPPEYRLKPKTTL